MPPLDNPDMVDTGEGRGTELPESGSEAEAESEPELDLTGDMTREERDAMEAPRPVKVKKEVKTESEDEEPPALSPSGRPLRKAALQGRASMQEGFFGLQGEPREHHVPALIRRPLREDHRVDMLREDWRFIDFARTAADLGEEIVALLDALQADPDTATIGYSHDIDVSRTVSKTIKVSSMLVKIGGDDRAALFHPPGA